MTPQIITAVIWSITLIFTIGVQYGIYQSFTKRIGEKFNEVDNRIKSLDFDVKSKDKEIKDLHRESVKLEIKIVEMLTKLESINANMTRLLDAFNLSLKDKT